MGREIAGSVRLIDCNQSAKLISERSIEANDVPPDLLGIRRRINAAQAQHSSHLRVDSGTHRKSWVDLLGGTRLLGVILSRLARPPGTIFLALAPLAGCLSAILCACRGSVISAHRQQLAAHRTIGARGSAANLLVGSECLATNAAFVMLVYPRKVRPLLTHLTRNLK